MNVILILGSYHTDDGLSDSGKQRVKQAVKILLNEPDSMALVSGGELRYGTSGPHHELVANELQKLGIAEKRILARLAEATTTVAEASAAAKLLESTDYELLNVVTSFAHFPRAPFIFAHFFPISRLRFTFVPDDRAKDVMRYTYFKEAEAYQELRSQGGICLEDGGFVSTCFTHQEFSILLRNQTDICVPGLREFESEITEDMDFFSYYDPDSPFIHGKKGAT